MLSLAMDSGTAHGLNTIMMSIQLQQSNYKDISVNMRAIGDSMLLSAVQSE